MNEWCLSSMCPGDEDLTPPERSRGLLSLVSSAPGLHLPRCTDLFNVPLDCEHLAEEYGSSSFLSLESNRAWHLWRDVAGWAAPGTERSLQAKVWRFFWKIPPKPSGVSGKPIQELKNHTLSGTHFLKIPHSC